MFQKSQLLTLPGGDSISLNSGQNPKSSFWESVLRPQEETSVSSQTSTEKRYSANVIVVAVLHADNIVVESAGMLSCVIGHVSTPALQSHILLYV